MANKKAKRKTGHSGQRRARSKRPRLPESAEFLKNTHRAVKSHLMASTDLPTFLESVGVLSLDDRKLLVRQALILLEQNYVHLPLKEAMHAVDPIQRLKLLQHRLDQMSKSELPSEMQFHQEMTDIFTSVPWYCMDIQ